LTRRCASDSKPGSWVLASSMMEGHVGALSAYGRRTVLVSYFYHGRVVSLMREWNASLKDFFLSHNVTDHEITRDKDVEQHSQQ
jgi:hypothetical protein